MEENEMVAIKQEFTADSYRVVPYEGKFPKVDTSKSELS